MSSWPPPCPLGMPLNLKGQGHPSGDGLSVNLKAWPDLHLCPSLLRPCLFLLLIRHCTTYSVPKTLYLLRRKRTIESLSLRTRLSNIFLKIQYNCPGWLTQLVRASSQYVKIVGSIPGQAIYKNQPVNHK